MKTIYETKATATGGRDGKVKTDNEVLNLDIRIPVEMGGQGGAYTNPEQLFAAGYAACFDSALNLVAREQKVRVKNTKVVANIGIAFSENDGFNITATLDVEIPETEKTIALDLLKKAHQVCPYSKAIKNNVNVTLNLI